MRPQPNVRISSVTKPLPSVRPDATHNIARSSDEDVDYYDEDDESADSVRRDSVAQPTAKELKALERDRIRKAKDSVKRVKAAVRKKRLDSIAVVRQAKATAQLERARAKELARAAKDSVKRAALRERMLRRGGDVSVLDSLDSLAAARSELLRHGHAEAATAWRRRRGKTASPLPRHAP